MTDDLADDRLENTLRTFLNSVEFSVSGFRRPPDST